MLEKIKQAYLPKTDFPVRIVDKKKCTQCRRCYEACPTNGYKWGDDGYPEPIGYGGFEQACLNCNNCIAVCPVGAISLDGVYHVKKGRYRTMLKSDVAFPDPLGMNGTKTFKDIEPELTEVERVIYKRRSNRIFKDAQVPKNTIKRILEAGRFAPSAGNCQPYKFIVITDKEVIRELEHGAMKLLRTLKNLYLDKKGGRRLWKNMIFTCFSMIKINSADPRPITAMEKADKFDEKIYWNAPAVIVICKDKRGISNPDLDAGICAQNMILAAHSLGLGTCYISLPMEPLSYPIMSKIRKRLGIGYPWVAVTSIALGYPKGRIDRIVKRDTPLVEWI